MVGIPDGDTFSRLNRVLACDGQTDGQTDRQTKGQKSRHGIVRAMHMRRAVKIGQYLAKLLKRTEVYSVMLTHGV